MMSRADHDTRHAGVENEGVKRRDMFGGAGLSSEKKAKAGASC